MKMTVPSPNQFPAICYQDDVTDQFYPTRSDLLRELTGFIKSEIQSLLADGVSSIQMDEPRYSYYLDPARRDHLRGLDVDPDKAFEEAVAAGNDCLADARRAGVTVAMHICRGNNQSKWYADSSANQRAGAGRRPLMPEIASPMRLENTANKGYNVDH